MSYRPFRGIGRCLLTAGAASLIAVSLSAQSPAAATGPSPSKIDIFMGYSYFGAHGQVKPAGVAFSSVDEGAALSGAYYFNKYVGGEILGFANPNGQNDGLYAGYAGPIFRAPMQNFTLFAHGLAGGVRIGGPNSNNPATFEHEPYTWGSGLVAGGGMDYDLPFFDHMFGLRVFEADYRYIHVDYGPSTTIPTGGPLGGRANLGAAELSAGILMHFGHIGPEPILAYTCTASPASVMAGEPVTVTGTTSNEMKGKTVAYTWSSDAGPISSTSNVANVDTKNLEPKTYNVKGHASEGKKPNEMADCTATFTINPPPPPPTLTEQCTASPSTLTNPGDPATITSTPGGGTPPYTYTYSTTAGTITGSTSTATLTTAGAAPGVITVTCNVSDSKGQTASANANVTLPQPEQKVTKTIPLCTASFEPRIALDRNNPTRVNNEAKACLDDVAGALTQQSDAKLAIVGNAAADESNASHKAAERAVNAKEYLVKEKGVTDTRIAVYTGTAGTKTDAITEIPQTPTVAVFDTTGLTPVDESSVKPVPRSRKTPAKHGRRRHHKAS